MHVAVAIVGYRNSDDIVRCLASLALSEHTDFEVSICENGGEAAARALRAVLPAFMEGGQPVKIIASRRNLGFADGVNQAMAACPDADAWWVINPDTVVSPGALSACLRRLEHGDCDAVGCPIHLPDGTVQAYGGHWRPALARAVSLGQGRPSSAPVDAEAVERAQSYLNGACMLIGQRFLEVVGPMRVDYFLYAEEIEWFMRGKARGMKLGFAGDASVLHYAGATTGSHAGIRSRPKMPIYLDERNKLLVTRDCFPHLAPVAAVAALGLLLLRFARRGAWAQTGYALAGWWAGVRNARGIPAWVNG